MKRIFITSILTFLVIPFLIADGVQPIGSGSLIDPYQVETLDNLLWISTNSSSWDSHYIQIADIFAADTENWNDGEGFSPIGDLTINFTGSYNGLSHFIYGLYINRNEAFNQGIFGRITDSTIENLIISNVVVYGHFNAGGLIAHAINSVITNCTTQGEVYGSNNVGGLIGIAEDCLLNNCENNGYVFGDEFIGGLIGQCYQSSASVCSSFGLVEGIGNLGGWSGLIFDSSISNCFSHSNIEPFMSAGGFAGTIMQNSIIDKCYSIGNIEGGVADIGGLVGMNISALVTNSFWDIESSGQNESDGGTGKTTFEMHMVSTYTDLSNTGLSDPWDFVDNPFDDIGNSDFWDISDQVFDGYPFLTIQFTNSHEVVIQANPDVVINNFPNPFNPATTFTFSILSDSKIELIVFNTKGQRIKRLVDNEFTSGNYSIIWNGDNESCKSVSSGVYIYTLTVNGKTEAMNKCLLLK